MVLVGRRSKAREWSTHLPRYPQQHISSWKRVEYRLHDRLHQTVDPRARSEIIPAFKCMVLGKYEIAESGSLVEIHRRGHFELDLLKLRSEPAGLGQSVRGIGVVHHGHRYLPGV